MTNSFQHLVAPQKKNAVLNNPSSMKADPLGNTVAAMRTKGGGATVETVDSGATDEYSNPVAF